MNRFVWVICLVAACMDSKSQSFVCDGDLYMVVAPRAINSRMYRLIFDENSENITFSPLPDDTGLYINAIGYRKDDNFIYGINPPKLELYRIQASGASLLLKKLQGLDPNHHFIAGDVTPDGKHLILQGGRSENNTVLDTEIVFVELTQPHGTEIILIETFSGADVRCADIAFHPHTGQLYGFDGLKGRLVLIDPVSGRINDQRYPAVGISDVMASLFFDAFGNLFGYGRPVGERSINTLYSIDLETGMLRELATGPEAEGNDGCACPFTLDLFKSVSPKNIYPCADVEYTFQIANASSLTLRNLEFEDNLPEGLIVEEIIYNPYSGIVSGIGTSQLKISDMVVHPGIDSFIVRVSLDDVEAGVYKNQAKITNIPEVLGTSLLSDDPVTPMFDDSTALFVSNLRRNIRGQLDLLCFGDTAILDATLPGSPNYLWSNGSMESTLEITESGTYWVQITSECEEFSDTAYVEQVGTGIVVDLGPDQEIFLGEELMFEPIVGGQGPLLYNWSEAPGISLECNDCPSTSAKPVNNSIFALEVIDQYGCSASDSMMVSIDKAVSVYIPNVFTPNADGIHDQFRIIGRVGVRVNYFKVYNRWGENVFSIEDRMISESDIGWDGMHRGKYVNPGVFVWNTELEFLDGRKKRMSGSLTVIR